MYRRTTRSTLDEVLTRQDARMRLYDVHDNVLLYFVEVCLPVLKILNLQEYILYVNSIVDQLERGKYDRAWSGIVAFSDLPGVLSMFANLEDKIEPGVAILLKAAAEFGIP